MPQPQVTIYPQLQRKPQGGGPTCPAMMPPLLFSLVTQALAWAAVGFLFFQALNHKRKPEGRCHSKNLKSLKCQDMEDKILAEDTAGAKVLGQDWVCCAEEQGGGPGVFYE